MCARCNYCNMRELIRRAGKTGGNVVQIPAKGKLGGFEVYIVPNGENLDERVDLKTGNNLSEQWKAWMMEIPDKCVC